MNKFLPFVFGVMAAVVSLASVPARAEGEWEITPQSEDALELGLQWLAANQGAEGNWESNDLGLVSMGALAFMASGYAPGRGKYGEELQKALDFILNQAKPSGLLNIAHYRRDMYNHGLATFVLGQAHGMTTSQDQRFSIALDRALKLIAATQCEDGGWDYVAQRGARGHDLSLAVMQAKALRSAMDSGLDVAPQVIQAAVQSVREHYNPRNGQRDAPEAIQRNQPGQFTYSKSGGGGTIAMAAAGVVCLQEFGQYDDWRIRKNMQVIGAAIKSLPRSPDQDGSMPFDAYTLYYVGQAIYQVGGDDWKTHFPILRDFLIATQRRVPGVEHHHGSWQDRGARGAGRLGGQPGQLYATSVACFVLALPNRFLPILQEGRIERFRGSDSQ